MLWFRAVLIGDGSLINDDSPRKVMDTKLEWFGLPEGVLIPYRPLALEHRVPYRYVNLRKPSYAAE